MWGVTNVRSEEQYVEDSQRLAKRLTGHVETLKAPLSVVTVGASQIPHVDQGRALLMRGSVETEIPSEL